MKSLVSQHALGKPLPTVLHPPCCIHPARHLSTPCTPLFFAASMPMIKRHQMVYALLDDEIKAGLHALTMSTKTPAEIEKASAAKEAKA